MEYIYSDRPVLQPVLGGVHPVTRGSTFAGTAPGEQLPASQGSVMTTLHCRISSSLTAAGLVNEECAYSLKKGRGNKVITLLNCNWKYSFKFSTSLCVKFYGLCHLRSVW